MILPFTIFIYKNLTTGEQHQSYLKPQFFEEKEKLLRNKAQFICIAKFKPKQVIPFFQNQNNRCLPCKLYLS